jgi:hypothetical protein
MGSGSDEPIYWILTIVTTISYQKYKISIAHNQFTLSRYKIDLSEASQLYIWLNYIWN